VTRSRGLRGHHAARYREAYARHEGRLAPRRKACLRTSAAVGHEAAFASDRLGVPQNRATPNNGKAMNRNQYLVGEVASFRDWLALSLQGQPVPFTVGHRHYASLPAAMNAYAWPLRAKAGLPNPHNGYPYVHPIVPPLATGATLANNAAVLDALQHALRRAFRDEHTLALAGAVAGILHWGGVYTTTPNGGNKPWLARHHANLHALLTAVVLDHANGDDVSTVEGLRFNAGMTKVYALLIDDFIIYDSRVAASFTWLANHWWTNVRNLLQVNLPTHLRFGTLPANGSAHGHRNAAPGIFPGITRAEDHYTWNVRANWLLSDALLHAGQASQFATLREIEAALFQMGERVM